jgi:peroxiredoxin
LGTFKEPDFYAIEVAKNNKNWIPFWISEHVVISGHKDSLYSSSRVTDSPEHDFYSITRNEIKTLFLNEYVVVAREYVKHRQNDSLKSILDSIGVELGNYLLEKVRTNNDLISPIYFVMNDYLTIPKDISRKIYENLSERQQSSKYGKILKNQLSLIQKGDPAFFFTIKDYKGNEVDLTKYKGRYILLDFWASWCIPCLEELPTIRKLHDSYPKDKLQIIGVSLDTNHDNWTRSIEKNKMSWLNLSDLKGNISDIVLRYGVTSIPRKVLISPDGRVIESTPKLGIIEEVLENIFADHKFKQFKFQ